MFNTYSFQDVNVNIQHPSFGAYTATGAGLVSVTTTMANDRTMHDQAADGTVMISKIKTRNGSIAIVVQQTSELNAWLMRLFNFLESSDSSEWAKATVTIKSSVMQKTTYATGVSPQKQADQPYQAQGQNITWNFMAADIQEDAA